MPKHKLISIFVVFLCLSVSRPTRAQNGASFTGLGVLTESYPDPLSIPFSAAVGVSSDGSVVVGSSNRLSGNPAATWETVGQAVRWTPSLGVLPLVPISSSRDGGSALAVSDDGSTTVGVSTGNRVEPVTMRGATRWTGSSSVQFIGPVNTAGTGVVWTQAEAVSADGSVVVGHEGGHQQAFRWANGVYTVLGGLNGTVFGNYALDVSADGTVVVGVSRISASQQPEHAFRWEDGVMTDLGVIPGYDSEETPSSADAISADGRVIVGTTFGTSSQSMVRWVDGVIEEFGVGTPYGISGDGSVIVGQSFGTQDAFIWTESGGVQVLKDLLTNTHGLDLTGWALTTATAISADGTVIVGNGISPTGRAEGWKVYLDAGPELIYSVDLAGDSEDASFEESETPEFLEGEEVFLRVKVTNTGNAKLENVKIQGGINAIVVSPDSVDALEYLRSEPLTVGSLAKGATDRIMLVYQAKTKTAFTVSIDALEATIAEGPQTGQTLVSEAGSCSISGKNQHADPRNKPCDKGEIKIIEIVVNSTGDEIQDPLLDPAVDGCSTGKTIKRNGKDETECTLRAAIEAATVLTSDETSITFDIPLDNVDCTAVCLITPDTRFPTIVTKITIDGSSQPGIGIEIDGTAAGPTAGFRIESMDVEINALTISRFDRFGIEIYGGSGHRIVDSKIGIRKDNKANVLGGIFVSADATDITIGGPEVDDGNQIDGGIRVDGAGTTRVKILGNEILGPADGFGITLNGGSEHEITDNDIRIMEDETLSALGGILINDSVTDVTIGGLEEDDENTIGGGIRIDGSGTRGIQVLRNTIELPEDWTSARPLRVPVDMQGDGPSCAAWEGFDETRPNRGVPPPHILELNAGSASGIARAGATVVAYRVLEGGTDSGRYWARSVEAIGVADANNKGEYTIGFDSSLKKDDQVAVSMVDKDGNTSELSQLRRPVIYVPGIGGSWLETANGDNVWLPFGPGGGINANDRLSAMAMNADGTDIIELFATEILDSPLLPYSQPIGSIEDAGYSDTSESDTRDLWRFPYDWRKSTAFYATALKTLVETITGGGNDVAISCEVDIVTHSNGGLVASVYVRRDAAHARDHVHRLITVAAPYLGASKAAASHATGYVFEVEKTPAVGFDVEWGRMIAMSRNMTGAYGLMPSKKFWLAADSLSPSHKHGFLFQNLFGRPLKSYEETAKFLTDPKVDANGSPLGLARNGDMIAGQERDVHSFIDDWTDWQGPPQVFRQIGALFGTTVTGFRLGPSVPGLIEESVREEPGDTEMHVEWRERIQPIFGWGDETVPLLSASLGADTRVSVMDYSGEDSPWIEPSQYYECTHTGIVLDNCMDQKFGGSINALAEVQYMLRSGYRALNPQSASGKSNQTGTAGAEMLYVTASGPVAVTVEDSLGNQTGPVSGAEYRVIRYEVPDIAYWPGEYGVTVSVPKGIDYTLTITSPVEDITVRVYRMQVEEPDETRRSILFDDQQLGVNGAFRLTLDATGTSETKPLSIDSDGDGVFEDTVEPAAVLSGTVGYPAVPTPDQTMISLVASGDDAVSASVILPDVGTDGWTWTLENSADWLTPSSTTGIVPTTISLDIAADSVSDTLSTTVLNFTLTYNNYEVEVSLPVELRIGNIAVDTESMDEVLPDFYSLSPGFPNPFVMSTTFELSLASTGYARVVVFDILGRKVSTLHSGVLTAGKHRLIFGDNNSPSGIYFIQASSNGWTKTRKVVRAR